MDRNAFLGWLCAAGLVAALWYILVPTASFPATAQSDPTASAAASVDGARAPPDALSTGIASVTATEEDGKGWFPTDTMSTVSGRYHAMRDKRRFVDLAMKTGGGANLAFVRLAYGRCAPVNGRPGAIAEQWRKAERSEKLASYEKAIARGYEGCEGFETRPIGDSDKLPLQTTFWGASDPAARAMRLEGEEDPERIRREAGALLGEGDPLLIALLSESLARIVLAPGKGGSDGSGSPASVRSSTQAEVQEEYSAWTLARCRLGIECRKVDSWPWLEACNNMGHCGDNFAETLAREEHQSRFDAVRARSEIIEKAIRDRNWRSLGF